MKKLGPQETKILKIAHLIFVMMWVIGVITMALIYLTKPTSGDELYMSFRIMRLVDDFLVIPGAMLTTFTGILYGVFTNWGFFKHRWIIIKWAVSLTIIIVGTFYLSPLLDDCLNIANETRNAAMNNMTISRYSHTTFICACIQSAALVFLVIISVLKPWKKKRI